MNAQTNIEPPSLAKLREPFPDSHISWLPKETRAQADARKARESGCMVWNCAQCGNHHHKDATHFAYVGHAALTLRLLDTDPQWSWEPMGYTPEGLPAFDQRGGLWIKLTVLGMTRLGYGHAGDKSGGDAIKEIIGDALRNAAMRFGAALDLWHKGDLYAGDETTPGGGEGQGQSGAVDPPASDEAHGMPDAEWARLVQLIEATKADTGAMLKRYKVKNLRELSIDQYADAIETLNKKLARMARDDTDAMAREAANAFN